MQIAVEKIALYENEELEFINDCFVAGMLHDIGKLLMLAQLGKKYVAVIEGAKEKLIPLHDEEMNIFQANHSDIGAYLVGIWGFQGNIVEAIGFCDRLHEFPGTSVSVALVVHVANVSFYKHFPNYIIGRAPVLNLPYIQNLQLDDKVEEWLNICDLEIQKMAAGE